MEILLVGAYHTLNLCCLANTYRRVLIIPSAVYITLIYFMFPVRCTDFRLHVDPTNV